MRSDIFERRTALFHPETTLTTFASGSVPRKSETKTESELKKNLIFSNNDEFPNFSKEVFRVLIALLLLEYLAKN